LAEQQNSPSPLKKLPVLPGAAELPPIATSKTDHTTSPDYLRWISIPKNIRNTPPNQSPYIEFITQYKDSAPNYSQLEKKRFTGENAYTGELMAGLLGTSSSYGEKIRPATQIAFDYQVKIPRRSTDPLENIAGDAGQIARYPIFKSRIAGLTRCKEADCKEDSLIVAACAINELARALNPGQTAEIELVAGLYFGEGAATNGWGHAWTKITTPNSTNIVDLALAAAGPAKVLPANATDRVGIASYYVSIAIKPDNSPEFTTGQRVLLAPPQKMK
jgi:hypothetical protein